jgi:hypothetical protein
MSKQSFRIATVGRERGNADAQANAQWNTVDFNLPRYGPLQACRELFARRVQRCFSRDQVEFVTPEAGQKRDSCRFAQAPGELAQQCIAGSVAEHVVDVLEAVKVDAEQGERLARNLRSLQHLREIVVERRPIGQIGQAVMASHVGHLRFGALLLGDVLEHAQQKLRLCLAVQHRVPSDSGDARAAAGGGDRQAIDQLRPRSVGRHDIHGRLGKNVFRPLAEDVVAGNAPEFLGGPIDENAALLGRLVDDDADRDVFDDHVQELAGLLELHLGALAFRQVEHGDDGRRAAIVLQGSGVDRDVDCGPVRLDMSASLPRQVRCTGEHCVADILPLLGRDDVEERKLEEPFGTNP